MYTDTQIAQITLEHSKEIAALWESVKSAHKRIDETGELTASVNQLAQEMARFAEKVEYIAVRMDNTVERIEESMDKTVERIEDRQKSQGERIGNIENVIATIKRNENELEKQKQRIDDIVQEPAAKWKGLVAQVITLMVGAVFAMVMSNFM